MLFTETALLLGESIRMAGSMGAENGFTLYPIVTCPLRFLPELRAGVQSGSWLDRFDIAASPIRKSSTDRAIGPWTLIACVSGGRSVCALGLKAGTRPRDGRIDVTPQQNAG